MTKTKALILLLLSLLAVACDKEEQDYRYVITNKTTMEDPITVKYTVEGNKEESEKELLPGDSIVIAERLDIRGKAVWDVETSVELYKIKTLHAFNQGETKISEELAFRRLWNGPTDMENVGIYQLDITDNHFVLTKQPGYTYCVKNELHDTVFATSHLKLISGENTTRSSDTILKGTTHAIGSVEIYTYSDTLKGETKYKTQKMSGLSSLYFLYKKERYTINTTKDTAYFEIGNDTCTLVLTEKMDLLQKKK